MYPRPFHSHHAPVVLVWLCLALLPFGRLVEYAVGIMTAAGLYLVIKRGRVWLREDSVRLLTAVFLSLWIPIALSLPDAANLSHTLTVCVIYWRFYFAGLFVICVLSDPSAHRLLLRLCAWLLVVWIADAFIQLWLGVDLLGHPLDPQRLGGLFHEQGSRLGLVVAVFSPLLWVHARAHWTAWGHGIAIMVSVVLVAVAGNRAGWIVVSVAAVVYALIFFRAAAPRRTGATSRTGMSLAILALAVAGAFALWHTSDRFARGFDGVLTVLVADQAPVTNSINHRIWIWRGAANMAWEHPINGVGARGFRYVFEQHADPDDPYLALTQPLRPTNAHQLLLEILAETGVAGLVGLVVAVYLLVRAATRAAQQSRRAMLPYGLALLAGYFPLNSHPAFYSTFWSQLTWWLIALYCAAYGSTATNRDTTVTPP